MPSYLADLGERQRLEAALKASEERFLTLVHLSFDVYRETDAEHRFTRQDFAPALHYAKAAAASDAALRGGPRYDVEYRVVRPDGTLRMVHSRGT